jgi:hypothetical protein
MPGMMAGLDGIAKKIEPPDPVDADLDLSLRPVRPYAVTTSSRISSRGRRMSEAAIPSRWRMPCE